MRRMRAGRDAAPARPALVRPGSRGAPDPALRTLRSVRRELLLDGRSKFVPVRKRGPG
jgi:hypothetical protein